MAGLTGKQLAFVDAYLGAAKYNASEAARMAGYHQKSDVSGFTVLSNSAVKAEIARRLKAQQAGPEEIKSRFTEQIRFDSTKYFTIEDGVATFDLEAIKADGFGYMVKKITNGRNGANVEFYDVQVALDRLARIHGLYSDTSGGVNDRDSETMGEAGEDNAGLESVVAAFDAVREKLLSASVIDEHDLVSDGGTTDDGLSQ